MYSNVKKTYQQANVMTANPMKLVLMCYEGAVSNLKIAIKAYEAHEFETKAKALQKTLNFIDELNASLDMQKGGDVALNLRRLYNYMSQILTEADLKKDIKVFGQVVNMLEELESAWKTLVEPKIAVSDAKKENPCDELKPVKNHHVGTATYGRPLVAPVTARAWSV